MGDASAKTMALQSGQVDLVENITNVSDIQDFKDNPDFTVDIASGVRCGFSWMNFDGVLGNKTLRQAILKGELEPGERLMEIQLAERLGVSRTPIREAIRKLELEGLVLMIPRKGAEVAKISESNLRDVLEVRRSLEELAIDLACQRITAEELESLNKAEVDFKAAIGNGDAMQIAQTDEQFHEIIYNSTKNQKLVQILNNLREQMYRYRLEYIKDADKRQILMVEHEHILKALTLRHIQEAKMAVREHIDNQEITILKNLKEQENDIQRKVPGRRN